MRSRARRSHANVVYSRRHRMESLEDRSLLAGVVVGNNSDLVNGNTTSITALISNNGGDGISLREAILAAKPIRASLVASPSFSRLRRRWVCTVVSPISSSLAMSRVDIP